MKRALEGRVAVVTGAGTRVGAALARALGARGAAVVVHYHRSSTGAQQTARAIRRAGSEALLVKGELTEVATSERLFAAADELGGCDLLVNSAAIFERKPVESIDDESWRRMLEVNLTAPFRLSRAALPSMRRKGRGDILNMVDIGGALKAWSGYAHYCAAKAGLATLTRCLALELAPEIRVNGIAPGAVLFPEGYGSKERKRVTERIPLQRVGSPEDVVQAALFLLEGSQYVTGQIIAVDGGRSIA